MAQAYLITWSTHGAWLHGDRRGSVDRSGEHAHGRPRIAPAPHRVAFERAQMSEEPVRLDRARRDAVDRIIREHLELRGWGLLAMAVRTNHVHLVVASPERPEKIMVECKAWATRALRSAGLVGADERVWARHGSTRYLFHRDAVNAAIHYVEARQGPEPRT